jgi:hypothetical protein
VQHAFIERDTGPQRKDQDRDDEAPEIEFAAIAERVQRIGGLGRARPCSSSNWLVESTRLWTPSVSMAEEPVSAAAPNLATAMPTLAPSAIRMVRVDPPAMVWFGSPVVRSLWG